MITIAFKVYISSKIAISAYKFVKHKMDNKIVIIGSVGTSR